MTSEAFDIHKTAASLGPLKAALPVRLDRLCSSKAVRQVANNSFFKLWKSSLFTADEFETFCRNYFARVYATTRRVAVALATIEDWQSRIELLHNLDDELGHGVAEHIHVYALQRWMNSLYMRLGGQIEIACILATSQADAETLKFVLEAEDLCRHSPAAAAGAILAQEWHGYDQIANLMDGFLQYKNLYDDITFHDEAEYFYVHLGRAEKSHKIQAVQIALRHCVDEASTREVEAAFTTYIALLGEFWEALAGRIVLARAHSTKSRHHSSPGLHKIR
jgi:hypothetical protein